MRLGKPAPTAVPPLDDDRFERALYLHMAALMVVEETYTSADKLMDAVLKHEEHFWTPTGAGSERRDRLWNNDVRRVVTALTLRGGARKAETETLVKNVGLTKGVRDEPELLALLMHDLYPGNATEGVEPPLHVAGLEPDLLGEAMVRKALRQEDQSEAPKFLKQALEGAEASSIQNAFDVPGRISAEHAKEARPWIQSVLDQDVPGRALAALSAAKSVGRTTAHAVLGEELAKALERKGTVELAKQIEKGSWEEKTGIPFATVSSREVNDWALRAQLAALPKSEHEDVLKERARLLTANAATAW